MMKNKEKGKEKITSSLEENVTQEPKGDPNQPIDEINFFARIPKEMIYETIRHLDYEDVLKLSILCKDFMGILFLEEKFRNQIIVSIHNPFAGIQIVPNTFILQTTTESAVKAYRGSFYDMRKLMHMSHQIEALRHNLLIDLNALEFQADNKKGVIYASKKPGAVLLGAIVYLTLLGLSIAAAVNKPEVELHHNKSCATEADPDRRDCKDISTYTILLILWASLGLLVSFLIGAIYYGLCLKFAPKEVPTYMNADNVKQITAGINEFISAIDEYEAYVTPFALQDEQDIVTTVGLENKSAEDLPKKGNFSNQAINCLHAIKKTKTELSEARIKTSDMRAKSHALKCYLNTLPMQAFSLFTASNGQQTTVQIKKEVVWKRNIDIKAIVGSKKI